MKLFVAALLLPLVTGECPEVAPVECHGADLLCGGEVDPWSTEGCMMPMYCMPNGPTGTCQASCPVNCGINEIHCHGGWDANGCEMPAICIISDPESPCPITCPATCGPNDIICGGELDPYSTNGCTMPMYCMPNDPTSICQASCPITCGIDEMWCYGGMDTTGCEMPATCVPAGGMCFR